MSSDATVATFSDIAMGVGVRHAQQSAKEPLVIDLRDVVDADVRAVCLRALHDLATTDPRPAWSWSKSGERVQARPA
jgi:hypothetical protein